jgi:hypothetical protein
MGPHRVPHPLAPPAQLACYDDWLKVSLALRYALSYPWAVQAWAEVRQQILWMLKERDRLRHSGVFN